MKIEIPTECPSCSYKLVRVNDQLFCENSNCTARFGKRMEHFAKVLGIKGLGPRTIEDLELACLEEIFYLDEEEVKARLGSARLAEKLLSEIENSKNASLDKVIAAFSIPLVGQTIAKRICAVIDDIDDITEEKCKEAKLGAKAAANLITWLNTEFAEIREFLPFSLQVTHTTTVVQNGQTVCITGKLVSYKTKNDAYDALIKAGYSISESVSKKVDFLVDEGDSSSSKRVKAESLGIPIVTNLKQFLE